LLIDNRSIKGKQRSAPQTGHLCQEHRRDGTALWEPIMPCPCRRRWSSAARTLSDPDAEALPRDGVNIEIVPDAGRSMAWDNPAGLANAIGRTVTW